MKTKRFGVPGHRFCSPYMTRKMRKFPCWRLPMDFGHIAWRVFCVAVACLALLDMLAAAAGDAVLPAKTPGPCSLLVHTSRRMPCRAGSPSIVWPRERNKRGQTIDGDPARHGIRREV